MNSQKEIICTIVREFDGRLTKPKLQGLLYLFDRKSTHTEQINLTTKYKYMKTNWSVTAGKQFTNDLSDLINTNILYKETDVQKTPSHSYTVDHRSRFETIIDKTPSDVQDQVATVCQMVSSEDSVQQKLRSLPEVSSASKYEQLKFSMG